jgi:serine/threonine protein kinase
MSEWAGRTLSKVVLERPLGRGGMAEVYLGRHTTLNIPVAVKILYAHLTEDEDLQRRFTTEAQAIASLRHSNIVHVYDSDVVDGRPYIVMELLEGISLEAYLQALGQAGLSLPLATIAHLIRELAGALDYAHAKGIVHRDIKPSNVILRAATLPVVPGLPLPPDVQPILTDFGIARIAGADKHTATGSLLGTPAYMSPEQARGEPSDARSDVYALGVMLYEMLAGRVPFESDSDTPLSVLLKHISDPLPPIADTEPAIQAVVNRALAKQPAERFASAGELARALAQALGPASSQPTPAPHPAARPAGVRRRPSRAQWAIVALVGVLALVLGGIGLRALLGSLVPASPPTASIPTPPTASPAAAQAPDFVPLPESEALFADAVLDLAIQAPQPAPPGSVFVLWFVKPDGSTVQAARLEGAGHLLQVRVADPESRNLLALYDGFLITLEPQSSGSETPGGPVSFRSEMDSEVVARVRALDAVSRQLPTSTVLPEGLRSQAASFDSHLEFAVEAMANGDLEMAKRHAEHMVNIAEGELGADFGDINGDGRDENPGDAFGLLPYLALLRDHAASAAAWMLASPEQQSAAGQAVSEADRLLADAAFARDLALRLAASDTLEEAKPLSDQLLPLRLAAPATSLADASAPILLGLRGVVLGLP